MKTVPINVKVTKETRHDFKLACLQLYTTMADVLRDAIDEAIVRAAAEREKGNGIGQS